MKILITAVVSLVFVLGLLTVGHAHEGHSHGNKKIFTKHFQNTLFDITEHGAYSVEVLLDDKEYNIGKDVVGIVVHDEKDSDVIGAKITIVHKNIATGEPVPGTLTITDKKNGLYIVSGLNLQREGRWELSVTVKKDDVEDSVKFIFPDVLKERHPKGTYSP
jgi:hypothetical protein